MLFLESIYGREIGYKYKERGWAMAMPVNFWMQQMGFDDYFLLKVRWQE